MISGKNKKEKLAIIIPAYKSNFFDATLQSIANQTCKDFTLYIGDDASPEDLYSIVAPFENRIKLIYHRFTENLGGADLVAHWERCVNLSSGEEWIWLFADDDIMEANCVEKFYETINQNNSVNLLHFDISIIDQHDKIIKTCNPFPEQLPVASFFSKRIKFQINSSVVEYIFKRDTFKKYGFKHTDLAWCADDAAWIMFGKDGGILTIPDAKVNWRYSGANISSNVGDKAVILRKVWANVGHIKWATAYLKANGLIDSTTGFEKVKWAISTIVNTQQFSFNEKCSLVYSIIDSLGFGNIKLKATAYLAYRQLKK